MASISVSALAADLPARKSPPSLAAEAASGWTGFYAGVNGGWGWAQPSVSLIPTGRSAIADITPQFLKASSSGGLAGVQLGYNWQSGAFVYGLEADFDGASVTGNAQNVFPSLLNPADTSGFMSAPRVDWLGTLRGRVGMTFGQSLAYVTGGAAWEGLSNRTLVSANTAAFVFGVSAADSFKTTRSGFALGAGVETKLSDRWTAKVEYLYYGFRGTTTNSSAIVTNCALVGTCGFNVITGSNSVSTLRVGLNYQFGAPASAVVAKY